MSVSKQTIINWEKGRVVIGIPEVEMLSRIYKIPKDNIFLPYESTKSRIRKEVQIMWGKWEKNGWKPKKEIIDSLVRLIKRISENGEKASPAEIAVLPEIVRLLFDEKKEMAKRN